MLDGSVRGGVMFGRNEGMKAVAGKAGSARRAATEVADSVAEYVDPLVKDEKFRERLAAATVAAIAAQQRMRARTGPPALLRRVAADPVLRAQLLEVGDPVAGCAEALQACSQS